MAENGEEREVSHVSDLVARRLLRELKAEVHALQETIETTAAVGHDLMRQFIAEAKRSRAEEVAELRTRLAAVERDVAVLKREAQP